MEMVRTYTARKVLLMFCLSFATFCLFTQMVGKFLS